MKGKERPRASTEAYVASFQEKFLVYSIAARTKTDTGGQGEDPEVSERTVAKELGKMTP